MEFRLFRHLVMILSEHIGNTITYYGMLITIQMLCPVCVWIDTLDLYGDEWEM